jgi:hypothetical protein
VANFRIKKTCDKKGGQENKIVFHEGKSCLDLPQKTLIEDNWKIEAKAA